MSLSRIPVELLQEVLTFALYDNPYPNALLYVNKTFFELGQPILHAHLRFRSINQLILFAQSNAALTCSPKSLVISLAGGSSDFEVFKHLAGALRRCRHTVAPSKNAHADQGETSENPQPELAQVPLDVLSLRLHSHSGNPHLSYIYEALSMASPKTFIWRGPDPEHHFSTAIVPSATYHLIRAIGTWRAIEHITLTNMSFPSDELGRNMPFSRDAPLLPPLPSLRTLYIGQATLLTPGAVAAMLARTGEANGDALERVRLVDTYKYSIWGPRIRRRDVEDAVADLKGVGDKEREREVVERIRRVVRCEKKTERLMGGDNGDEESVLN